MSILHVTNGSVLTERLDDFDIPGEIVTWNEMLCEGATALEINSEAFIRNRTAFLKTHYDISEARYVEKFVESLNAFQDFNQFQTVYLWFEYDLFCHINLLATISWLNQSGYTGKLQLVCSGRVKGEDSLKGLGELTRGQLLSHYENAILLKKSDVSLALQLWKIYNSPLPNQFKKYIQQPSSFPYLSNCLSAHLKRFPSSHNGLNLLETHTLNLISQNTIRSTNQLVGYVLQYQGYYGYGDSQIIRMIRRLKPFFVEEEHQIILNDNGQKALRKEGNFFDIMKDDMQFGGASKYNYTYNIETRQLTAL